MKNTFKTKHGFVLGKFMPLHKGHEHLLRFASERSEKLTIMVCSLPTEPIPGTLRFEWVKRVFPNATVVHYDAVIPQEPKEDPLFWEKWNTAINSVISEKVTGVFASEDYGWRLAEELDAQYIPIDTNRAMIPISGTAIRNNPYENWKYISNPVRSHYVKRVAIVGPESSGKSTLVSRLAKHFNTIGVEEYARQYFDDLVRANKRQAGEFTYEDLSYVASGQAAIENSLAEESNIVLICDTDVVTTQTWADHLYGKHEPWMEELGKSMKYDVTLVLHPEGVEYVQDGQRVMVEYNEREKFTQKLLKNLDGAGRKYEVLKGSYDGRFNQAVEKIEELFSKD